VRRVLFISPAANLGGAERSLLDLVQCIDRELFEPMVLLLETGPLSGELKRLDIESVHIPLPGVLSRSGDSGGLLQLLCVGPGLILFILKLKRVVSGLKPDILYTNGIKAHLLGSFLRSHNRKLIWHVRDYLGERGTSRELIRKRAKKCDLAICNSRSVEMDFQDICEGVPTTTVYNAVEVGDLPLQPTLRLTRVCLVGTYAVWKGHHLFLEAIACRQEELRDRGLTFQVIGGAVYKTRGSQVDTGEMQAFAEERGIQDMVSFPGFQQTLEKLYANVDVLVNASIRPEPFGRTLIEAMAFGKVVIAPDTGGPLEIIEDGVTGFHFQSGNAESLAQTILRAIDHPDIADMIKAAHRNVREHFSHEALRKRMSEVYGQLTSG